MRNSVHCLKMWPEFFAAIMTGCKTFDLRLNDRQFVEGDSLVLQEFDPNRDRYTGEMTVRRVVYILGGGPGLCDGYVVMGLAGWTPTTSELLDVNMLINNFVKIEYGI